MSDRPATPPPTDLTDAGTMAICSALPALELDHADEAAIARAVLAAPLVAARLAGPGQVIIDANDLHAIVAILNDPTINASTACAKATGMLRALLPDDSVAPAGRDPHDEKG